MKLRWKDQNGIRLETGDEVMICDPGMSQYGVIEYNRDFAIHMVRVTHRLLPGNRWQRVDTRITCHRTLAGRKRLPFTSRLKGVYLLERRSTETLQRMGFRNPKQEDTLAPLPLV